MSQLAMDRTTAREAGLTASEACTARAERVASFDTAGAALFSFDAPPAQEQGAMFSELDA